jgi:hypothetical protein
MDRDFPGGRSSFIQGENGSNFPFLNNGDGPPLFTSDQGFRRAVALRKTILVEASRHAVVGYSAASNQDSGVVASLLVAHFVRFHETSSRARMCLLDQSDLVQWNVQGRRIQPLGTSILFHL